MTRQIDEQEWLDNKAKEVQQSYEEKFGETAPILIISGETDNSMNRMGSTLSETHPPIEEIGMLSVARHSKLLNTK